MSIPKVAHSLTSVWIVEGHTLRVDSGLECCPFSTVPQSDLLWKSPSHCSPEAVTFFRAAKITAGMGVDMVCCPVPYMCLPCKACSAFGDVKHPRTQWLLQNGWKLYIWGLHALWAVQKHANKYKPLWAVIEKWSSIQCVFVQRDLSSLAGYM